MSRYDTCRDRYRPIIARVLDETRGGTESEIRKALRDAFPSGERAYWPYKVWLDEIRVQRGKKRPKAKAAGPDEPELC